ncbi:MAG: DNA-binding protein [Chloroflexota bacterium]
MKPETAEWIEKAEGDWKVAQRESQAADPVWNVVCFLAQQCAEKYLKAFLEEQNIAFQKTHDLVALFNLSGGRLAELEPLRPELARLSTLGIAARYPGAYADREAAEDAMRIANKVQAVIKGKLALL